MTYEQPTPEDIIEGSGILGDRRKLRNFRALTQAHRLLDKWTDIARQFTDEGDPPLYIPSLNAIEQDDNFAECLSLLQGWSTWWNNKFGSVAQDTDYFIDQWTH